MHGGKGSDPCPDRLGAGQGDLNVGTQGQWRPLIFAWLKIAASAHHVAMPWWLHLLLEGKNPHETTTVAVPFIAFNCLEHVTKVVHYKFIKLGSV